MNVHQIVEKLRALAAEPMPEFPGAKRDEIYRRLAIYHSLVKFDHAARYSDGIDLILAAHKLGAFETLPRRTQLLFREMERQPSGRRGPWFAAAIIAMAQMQREGSLRQAATFPAPDQRPRRRQPWPEEPPLTTPGEAIRGQWVALTEALSAFAEFLEKQQVVENDPQQTAECEI